MQRLTISLLGLLSASSFFAADGNETFTKAQRQWWSLQPVARPALPAAALSNPIDKFLAANLQAKGLQMNPPADRITLLRRAHLTLTGLPPTPEETQAFLADRSADAFAKVVDRLLASPQYGERWARHWLDVVRYADSEGFKSDETRPNVWRYRDYVIRSLNQDKPYRLFVQEQVAGDELFPSSNDAKIATGFLRHFPDESNAANIMQRRQELLNDVTDTTASALLGLTVGCARCHDHKFDPILHKDYYRLQSFFSNVRISDDIILDTPATVAAFHQKQQAWEKATASIRADIAALLAPREKARYQERLTRFPEEIQAILTMPAEKRNPYEWQMYHKALPQVTFSESEIAGILKADEKTRYKELQAALAAFAHLKPAPLQMAQGMTDASAQAPPTHILKGGNHLAPLVEVKPGFLTILDATDAAIPALGDSTTGRRSVLAKWLTQDNNPLTWRVMVNRVWQHHFGKGIAGTPNDFGLMGERPTNPQLLDWLTSEFVANGTSLKSLHRQIMLSQAWQQSSTHRQEAATVDPDNKLLWHYPRRRLDGEVLRDSMLQSSGLLSSAMYGPGVFPPLPGNLTTRGGWSSKIEPEDARRRSIYTFVRRNLRYPMMEAFDMPDTHESCGRRSQTVSPTQALELMNSQQIADWSAALATRVGNDVGQTTEALAERAYRLVYSRQPSAEELAQAKEFLQRQQPLAGSKQAALADLCHALLNSNEFLYLN